MPVMRGMLLFWLMRKVMSVSKKGLAQHPDAGRAGDAAGQPLVGGLHPLKRAG